MAFFARIIMRSHLLGDLILADLVVHAAPCSTTEPSEHWVARQELAARVCSACKSPHCLLCVSLSCVPLRFIFVVILPPPFSPTLSSCGLFGNKERGKASMASRTNDVADDDGEQNRQHPSVLGGAMLLAEFRVRELRSRRAKNSQHTPGLGQLLLCCQHTDGSGGCAGWSGAHIDRGHLHRSEVVVQAEDC